MIDLSPYIDEKYALFASKIVRTRYPLLGVRMPILHKISKELGKQDREKMLTLISQEPSCEEWLILGDILALELKEMRAGDWWEFARAYLERIDSWNYVDNLFSQLRWIKGRRYASIYEDLHSLLLRELYCEEEFVLRFVIMTLTRYYPQSLTELLDQICDLGEETPYYLKMGASWAISEIFLKERQRILSLLQSHRLTPSIQSLSIRKICESKQVGEELKSKIKTLRRENGK